MGEDSGKLTGWAKTAESVSDAVEESLRKAEVQEVGAKRSNIPKLPKQSVQRREEEKSLGRGRGRLASSTQQSCPPHMEGAQPWHHISEGKALFILCFLFSSTSRAPPPQ